MSAMDNNWNAELYMNKHSFVYNYGESLVDLLDPNKNEKILDLGCGTGELTNQISKLSKEVIGIDKSPEMIKSAKENFATINFQIGSAENIKSTEEFDAVFSNATLHWVKDYQAAIQSIYESLKPGGRFVAEFGGRGNVETIIYSLRNSLAQNGYLKQSQTEIWYFPSIGEYTSALEKQNFKVKYAKHYDRPTELTDAKSGIKDWLEMFGKHFFDNVSKEDVDQIILETEKALKPLLFKKNKWYADYKRLQIIAYK
ncbi:class I SAM-dependent methyltransferase [Autumnicola musiva]|uniref:Methyltransferase domain-containing protein n=1 Tax=Autumnicola musiva TaxID=3075589 RepID=A0ABU3D8S2_9FLAO|nr:methyltransferase domain-containing protein [Zunongwangia sp. F117]MDT0677924.1 methyltransferase domain-containing protein [Zunongwangia sp. F117]